MAKVKILGNKSSNKLVAGTIPIYYWKDGTKLRLTDKSVVPMSAIILGIYENIDHIPQSIIDEVFAYNEENIIFTQYREKNKVKIIDGVKIGKSQTIQLREPTAKSPTKANGLRGIFKSDKFEHIPDATIKVYDGSSYWVNEYTAPAFGTYWWEAYLGCLKNSTYWGNIWTLGRYDPSEFWEFGPDLYQRLRYRLVDGVAITGHYKTDFIEVRESTENRTDPVGGTITELNTVGKYDCSSFSHNVKRFDARNHWGYVGMGTYEEIINGVYEGYFDQVIAENQDNTYNEQLGINYLSRIDVGVSIDSDKYTILSSPNMQERTYVPTKPAEVTISGGTWVGADGQIYVSPTFTRQDELPPPALGMESMISLDHRPWYDNWGSSMGTGLGPIGMKQEFPKFRDEMLHLSFTDDFGVYCDFNTSDTTNFCMSQTKGEYDTNIGIIIPTNSDPTIEVILIPTKWKYIIWTYGLFDVGANYTPKWLCTSFDGSSPGAYGHMAQLYTGNIESLRMNNMVNEFMYYTMSIHAEHQMLYIDPHNHSNVRYSYISTPNGTTFGPVYADPWVEDMVCSSLSMWLRLQGDSAGNIAKNHPDYGANPMHPPPAYSAWTEPRKAGQLVAIIRILYSNGAIDYRYVYAKTDSTADSILRAYACVYSSHKIGGVVYTTPEALRASWTSPPSMSALVVEDYIPTYYYNLYTQISNEYAGKKWTPGQVQYA